MHRGVQREPMVPGAPKLCTAARCARYTNSPHPEVAMERSSKLRLQPLAAGLVSIALSLAAGTARPCVEGDVRGEAVNVERSAGSMASGEEASMQVVGAGWFHAVEVVKKGRSTDHTSVTVELDGEPLMQTSFATLKNKWMQLQTNNIIATVRTVGDEDVLTLWYTPDVKFNTHVAVRVSVEEQGVADLQMRAVLSRALPHSHPAGQPGALAALPAFK
jgi:hypothetical protein